MSDHKFILNTFKMYFDVNKEPLNQHTKELLDMVDLVCVMTVNPGFGGQKFIESQIPKIAQLRSMVGDRPIHIEIDGGITPKTAPLVARAGADVLVAGSGVFSGGSVGNASVYGENIKMIRMAAEAAQQV